MGRLLQLARPHEATATSTRTGRQAPSAGQSRGQLVLNRSHVAVLHVAISVTVALIASHTDSPGRPWLVSREDPLAAAHAALGVAWRNSTAGSVAFAQRAAALEAFNNGHLVARGAMVGVMVLVCLVVALSLSTPMAAAPSLRSR